MLTSDPRLIRFFLTVLFSTKTNNHAAEDEAAAGGSPTHPDGPPGETRPIAKQTANTKS